MADIDLRLLEENDFVLHFGGRLDQIDAFTFSNSLLAFSEALREINSQLNPQFNLEISIEGLGEGSFRAKIATKFKSFMSLLAPDLRAILLGVLSNITYGMVLPADHQIVTMSNSDVVIDRGGDKLIIKRNVWEATKMLSNPHAVKKHVSKAFEVMADDPNVSDFGFAHRLHDKHPVGVIERRHFSEIAHQDHSQEIEDDLKRHQDHPAIVTIIRIVFEKGNRKWQFVWNGNKISAPITDQEFLDKVAAGAESFSYGDTLEVRLRVFQTLDRSSGAFINDRYEITHVYGHKKRSHQSGLPF